MTDTEACIALNMVPGMGPVRLRALLETFETPQRILAAGRAALRAVKGVGQETADAIASWDSSVDLVAELKRIADFGAKVITVNSSEYPTALRTIHNPPVVLYVWGDLRPSDAHAIGVVGSRNAATDSISCHCTRASGSLSNCCTPIASASGPPMSRKA